MPEGVEAENREAVSRRRNRLDSALALSGFRSACRFGFDAGRCRERRPGRVSGPASIEPIPPLGSAARCPRYRPALDAPGREGRASAPATSSREAGPPSMPPARRRGDGIEPIPRRAGNRRQPPGSRCPSARPQYRPGPIRTSAHCRARRASPSSAGRASRAHCRLPVESPPRPARRAHARASREAARPPDRPPAHR